MKKSFHWLASLVLTAAILFAMAVPAVGAINPRASDYFAATDVVAIPTGGGDVVIEVDVDAKRPMLEVGTTKICVYEQQSNGRYENVKTYTRYNTAGMIVLNDAFSFISVTYHGTSGVKYYATADVYAKDSNGSETLTFSTRIVTA